MSLGYGGWGVLDQVNEDSVIYKYGSYNLNEEEYRNADHICDGTITSLFVSFFQCIDNSLVDRCL